LLPELLIQSLLAVPEYQYLLVLLLILLLPVLLENQCPLLLLVLLEDQYLLVLLGNQYLLVLLGNQYLLEPPELQIDQMIPLHLAHLELQHYRLTLRSSL
jgi:hypothetical protein